MENYNNFYVPYKTKEEFILNDRKLNTLLIDVGNNNYLVSLGALGSIIGLGTSIFFKNKRFVLNYFKGVGIGYGFYYNCSSLFEK